MYLFHDGGGQPVYVGKARSLRDRLGQYRRAGRRRKQRRMRLILREAKALSWQVLESETAALLEENRLIRQLRPRLNIAGAWSFLYPVLFVQVDGTRLSLIWSTSPEAFAADAGNLFGTYRSRETTKTAWLALATLFDHLAHREPAARNPWKEKPWSMSAVWRRMPAGVGLRLLPFLTHGDESFLRELLNLLLEKPGARSRAPLIQDCIRDLRRFRAREVLPLHRARTAAGNDGFIPQAERDALFIRARSRSDT